MKKYISIVLVLCFLYPVHATADTTNQSSDEDSDREVVNSDTLEKSYDGVIRMLKRPSYGVAGMNLSIPAQTSWLESKRDTVLISAEEEEAQVKPGFNWKACCIAGTVFVAVVGFIMLASFGQWLTAL